MALTDDVWISQIIEIRIAQPLKIRGISWLWIPISSEPFSDLSQTRQTLQQKSISNVFHDPAGSIVSDLSDVGTREEVHGATCRTIV